MCFSQVGEFVLVEEGNNLRSQFGNYYSFFTNSDPEAPFIITVPYVDFFGLGEKLRTKNCYNSKMPVLLSGRSRL